MVHTQGSVFTISSAQSRTLLQQLFCHCMIFIVAVLSGAHMLATLCICLLSFFMLLTIPYNLHQLEIMLEHLVHSISIEPHSLRLRWPMAHLFILVNTLAQQAGQQVQIEKRNVAYRDQLLQQVSKNAAQEERNRLARDLHDSIKQQLFSIAVSAAAVRARLEHNLVGTQKIVADIERIAQEAQVEMQVLLQQLRPTALENVGLIESLRLQCQALGYRTGAVVIAELGELPPDELLPIGVQETIFRIVQEGFANIARHARATQVWLSLQRQKDTLLIEIGDYGQGFDLTEANESSNLYGGMGLSNVRERVSALGGTIAIWSLPNKGTTLHVCIPLLKPKPHVQEQANQEIAHALHQSHRILHIGIWTIELAAALILLYTPVSIALWIVLLCIIAALSSLLWSAQYKPNLKDLQNLEQLLLLRDKYGLHTAILLVSMLYLNYFEAFRATLYTAFLSNNLLYIIIFFGICISLLIACYMRFSRSTDRYYQSLSRQSLQTQLRQARQQVVIDWILWTTIASLTAFLMKFFPAMLIDTTVQYMGILLLCVWFLAIFLKSIRITYWLLIRRDANVISDQKERRI